MFHLKKLGFGKSSLEVVMLEEADNLIAEFKVMQQLLSYFL